MNLRRERATMGAFPLMSRGVALGLPALLLVYSAGCSSKAKDESFDPLVLGSSADQAPYYSGEKLTIYQVKLPVSLPLQPPSGEQRDGLAKTPVEPFGRSPWVTPDNLHVQLSWTVSNLDAEAHNVEVLVNPCNEFVCYLPQISIGEEEAAPDLSGLDVLMRVEGGARRTGVFTYDDMREMAVDLSTVQNMLAHPPPVDADGNDGLNGLVNHAFEIHNRSSDRDTLSRPYIPSKIAGLTGFDIGLRTYEKANVAIEATVELVDVDDNRVNRGGNLTAKQPQTMKPARTISAPPANLR